MGDTLEATFQNELIELLESQYLDDATKIDYRLWRMRNDLINEAFAIDINNIIMDDIECQKSI